MITFLNVPFAEKDKAKRLGARWNGARKQWFIENVEDITEFMRWMPGHLRKEPVNKPQIRAGKTTGSTNRPIDCGCCPPWEVCEHSFQWAKLATVSNLATSAFSFSSRILFGPTISQFWQVDSRKSVDDCSCKA